MHVHHHYSHPQIHFHTGSSVQHSYGMNPGVPQFGGMDPMEFLFNFMTKIAQFAQGWSSFGGHGNYGQMPPAQQGYNPPANAQPVDYASQHFPNLANYNPSQAGPTTTQPSYGGGNSGFAPNVPPRPSDSQEFASYIQAQIAGGALQGKTTVAQNDAIPESRFGQVQDPTMWHASLARNYAYQFAAQAVGANFLSPQGLEAGMQAFDQMKPEAQLFMQVASVFKGDLLDGPGFYDNPGLKTLLESKGLNQYLDNPQVGQTDVQTIGAITAAINGGDLSLNEVINSGTISDMNRYHQVIGYVSQGQFAADLTRYDNAPL